MQRDLSDSFVSASQALEEFDKTFVSEAAVNEAAGNFRPLQIEVRAVDKEIREPSERAGNLRIRAGRMALHSSPA